MDEFGRLAVVGRMAGFEQFKVLGDVVFAQAIEHVMKEMSSIENIVVGRPSGGASGHELAYCVQ